MIEQSVSLASNGVVKVPGYEQMVRFGYTKNRGVYRLTVTATGEWEGLTIRAFWHVPDGKDPESSLVVDGSVDVPASVTAQPGNGCITFEGSDGTKTVTSADLRYRVSANSGTEDGTEPEPDTPAWQQLVDAVHTDATAAEQAKTDAQTAAQQSEASAKKSGQALSDTISAKGTFAILAGDVIKFWCLSVNSGKTVDKTLYPYIVPGTTAPTTYTPYTGQTATLTLPHTIYGGTVDVVRGSGEKAWNEIALIDTYGWYASTNQYRTFYCVNIKNITRTTVENSGYAKNWKCTHFKSEAYSYAQSGDRDNTVSFQSDKEMLVITFPGSIDELKSYLAAQYAAGTPVQIAYKLAEPVPFTATGAQPISALSGANTVITDADSVTVTGRADPIKRIIDLEDAVASMTTT